ncbi:beta-lactamase [Dictyocaulus viviparus]|uniref:Beta-lactamase n=1 Tax=Dictyocaulus viviparus TaxID=29172 RepID=A0A0D8Y807_DICVI|nr:beta-lactamase [Dictyocaulus viviparus]
MGLLRYAVILGVIVIVVRFIMDALYTKYPLHFDGETVKEFDSVRKAFQQNFLDGWESEGASLAVFVKGNKVVDVWGGYADKQAARVWNKDTLTVVFSTTKAVAALCIAILADRGRLNYSDLVSKHWPGFSKNGKENITIEWVMSHMSGLPFLETMITEEMAFNHNLMRKVLEEEKPKFPPGTKSGYHAFTYGWLVDQIVRHTDEKRRGIGQFLREEITVPNGIDFHIGLNLSQEHRVARISLARVIDIISEVWYEPRSISLLYHYYTSSKNSSLHRMLHNLPWVDVTDKCTVNNPHQHEMEQAAAFGIGNARSLAIMFNMFINGRMVSEKTMSFLQQPVINETDLVFSNHLAKGHGFFYTPLKRTEDNTQMIHHPGHGCQQITMDLKNKVVIAYVTNGLKMGSFMRCRTYKRIHNAVYDILENSRK